ncbi:MAG: hypothetical protein LYZ69_07805 [Nitrososphaerales archaeon]|nr:hypothetical protein [Nitrososphaerales archaeon]
MLTVWDMRRMRKVAAIGIVVIVVLAFFFAPVVFWFRAGPTFQPLPHPSPAYTNVYRSLGCVTLGFGDLYASDWFGFVLGCQIPVPVPV